MTLGELIGLLGGTLAHGSAQWVIDGVSSTALASPSDVVFAEDEASAAKALASNAGAVVLRRPPGSYPLDKCVVETDQPRLWFARAGKLLSPMPPGAGIHPSAVLGRQVELGAGVKVGACAVIEDFARIGDGTRIEAGAVVGRGVVIGEHCHIYPRAVIYAGATLGNWVTVHAGAVLGADGFGYVRDPATGAYTQFPQQGTLDIEDDVEIGANTTIDRARFGKTWIQEGTKIDNLVQIAHNVVIGKHSIIVSQAGISGSSKLGQYVTLAGQVGLVGHIEIGDFSVVAAQSGVSKNVPAKEVWFGYPASPLSEQKERLAHINRLPKLFARVKSLEERYGGEGNDH